MKRLFEAPRTTTLIHRFRASAAAFRDGPRQAALRAAVTFVCLLAATLWLWREASHEATRVAQERFTFKVKEAEFAMQQRLKAYEQVLRGGVGLFAASAGVHRDAWRSYVGTLEIAKNYPGIQGIGFSQRVPAAQLEAHTRAMRAEGFPAYTVRPAGVRDEYTSIIYLEPFDWRNQRAFGYDMFSEPVRHSAMVAARDSGLPWVSGKVKLVQETSEDVQSGFLMYLPVYAQGAPLGTAQQRAAALQGYVYAPFRMNDLMRSVLEPGTWSELDLQVFDGMPDAAEALLYDSHAGTDLARRTVAAYSVDRRFDFDGRRWTLRFSSASGFDAAIDHQKPRLILVSGLLVSVLFTLVVWASSINHHRAHQVASANKQLRDEIKKRARLAASLELAKNEAEAAARAKGNFLANVSHELRTPLTLMLGPLEKLLEQAQPPTDWLAQTERVRRNALLLLNRVNDILDYSKAEAGKFELLWENVDLAQSLAPVMEDAAHEAEIKGCAFGWHVDPALGTVCADRCQVEKIVLNFVSNALKFTPGGGRIDVRARVLDDKWFEIEVADTGVGIAPDDLARLFKRFQQVDSSATRQHSGTGIGLALAKELAEAMGGRVGGESKPGQGSRFFVRLRRRARVAAVGVAADRADAQTLRRQAALRSARLGEGTPAALPDGRADTSANCADACILVADDNADMRSFLAELLGDEHSVVIAADGEQAWELLQRQHIDVVVSDVMMPGVDGIALTARIKTTPHLAHLPVLLLTARGGEQACVSGLACGADDYIAKPFSSKELKARVRSALRMSRAQAQLRERTREAGMAMLATGLLHNLGNVLTGLTVSSGLIRDGLNRLKLGRLRRVAELLRADLQLLPPSVRLEHGETLPAYVERLADQVEAGRAQVMQEADNIRQCIEHAVSVIAIQQGLAKPQGGVNELVDVGAVMDSALRLAAGAFRLDWVTIERDYGCNVAVITDRQKVLQILLNLLGNAGEALTNVAEDQRRITLRTTLDGGAVRLEVCDNGGGIEAQHLPMLFNQGFTTKPSGHGYGLHSSANLARELGGRLSACSDGPGHGARFTLELPRKNGAAVPEPADKPFTTEFCT